MGWVTMSERDLQRIEVLTEVMAGQRTVASAATVLDVSVRQVGRLLVRYRDDGGGGLIHKGRGRPSNHSTNEGSDRDLASQLDIDHRTVKKFRTAEVYPEAKPRVRESMVDDYANYLDQRLSNGCRSSTRLWRDLREQGFRGQVNAVRYWLRQRRNYRARTPLPPHRPILRASARQIVWFILKEAPSAKDML